MKIKPFKVEEWMNKYEEGAKYNIAETCVNSITLDELWQLTGVDKTSFWEEFCRKRLTYGNIEGNPGFLNGVCSLYKTLAPKNIVPTHGASGANHHLFYSIIEPGDRVISIMPTYQQLCSIPESYGADVQIMHLEQSNSYLPDLEELERLAVPGTKMICINNPNNPTGALISNGTLREIAGIAEKIGAYVLCDEVYRPLTQEDVWCESIADIYKKGISVSSMSKVFSMAGLRLGWIATKDMELIRSCLSHRDYTLISCGLFDETIAGIALEHKEQLLKRSQRIVRENLTVLDRWVSEEKHVSYTKPLAGTTALVYYDFDICSYEFCERLYHETGVFVTPGACFEEEHSMRIGYANDLKTLQNGLQEISRFIRKLEKEEISICKS